MLYEENEYMTLMEMLIQKYETHYKLNDDAHQIDHVISVANHALELNTVLSLNIDRRMIVVPAILHDLFTWSRSNHELLAYHHLMTMNEPWIRQFDVFQRQAMANACKEHRASYKGKYTGLLSELIASADRGKPTDIHEAVKRAYLYGTSKLRLANDEAQLRAIEHIQEKFTKTGYAKYPKLFLEVYRDELVQFQEDIKNITLDYFKQPHVQYLI